MENNILILHHDDRDGFMSAAVISNYLESKRIFKDTGSRIYTRSINYEQSLKEIFDDCLKKLRDENGESSDFASVYLVDYSISTDQNIKTMIDLDENYNLIWLDHHKSSIVAMDKNEKLKRIKGMRIIGISGAGLCWLYYSNKLDQVFDMLIQYDGTFKEVSSELALTILETVDTPRFVLYTHRYDIFDLDDQVLQFNYGYNTLNVAQMKIDIGDETFFDMYLKNGSIIKRYVDEQNKKLVKGFAVEVEYNDGSKTLKGLAMNNLVFTSLVYGDTINDYDFVVTYARKKNCWRCSIYTAKDNLDVSVIANKYNGGGHAKAAGFTTDKPLYELKGWKFKN